MEQAVLTPVTPERECTPPLLDALATLVLATRRAGVWLQEVTRGAWERGTETALNVFGAPIAIEKPALSVDELTAPSTNLQNSQVLRILKGATPLLLSAGCGRF